MTPYQQLWGVTDGAVKDAFNMHPDYLTPKGRQSAVASVTKRVTGTVLSFAVAAARGGETPAETDGRKLHVPSTGEAHAHVSPDPHCRIGRVKLKRRCRYRSASMFDITTNALIAAVKGGAMLKSVKG